MGELQFIAQFSQLSASAALTGVIGWLLYQMPKYLEQERASREMLINKHVAVIDMLMGRFEQQSKYERESCDKRHAEVVESIERRCNELVERIGGAYDVLREIRHEIANIAQVNTYKQALYDLQHGGKKATPPGTKP